jgi:hypothetical protein
VALFLETEILLPIYCALMLNNEKQPIGIKIIEDAKRRVFITHELGKGINMKI